MLMNTETTLMYENTADEKYNLSDVCKIKK